MDSPTDNNSLQSATAGYNPNDIDALLESMGSIVRLTRPSASGQRRERRFSDTDRPLQTIEDVNRTLVPAPFFAAAMRDEQSHATAPGSSTADLAQASQPQPVQEHKCTAAVCSVTKVFQTTELLDIIFNFLDFKEILQLRAVSRHCNSVVKESKHIRLQFFVHGQWRRPGAEFQLLPLSLPGVTIELGKELHLGQWVEVSFTPDAARRISPEPKPTKRPRSRSIFEGLRGGLGTRAQQDPWPPNQTPQTTGSTIEYEDLLIAQPPIVGMQAFIVSPTEAATSDEDESDDAPRACAKLSCDKGITLGFLAETSQSLLSQEDGPSTTEGVKILYKAIISFSEPDQGPRKPRSSKKTIFYL